MVVGCLVGSYRSLPAAGDDVHQVHPDLPSSGAVLRPDRSSTEAARPPPRSRRCDGPSSWAEERDGEPRTLRVSLLWRRAVRPQVNSGRSQQDLVCVTSRLCFSLVYLFVCLLVCISGCQQGYSKSYEWILTVSICCLSLQNDVEMPIPKYFVLEKAKALKEREKLLGQILSRLGAQDRDTVRPLFCCPVIVCY